MSQFHSATDLTTKLQAKGVTAEHVMCETLDRIAQVNPTLNAIVAMRDPDELLAAAAAADKIPEEDRGLLHGLPLAVKDTVNTAGIVSCLGFPPLAGHVPSKDDLVAARMRDAGAIFIGKTNIPEFALGSHSFNSVYGATKNPYAPDVSAGGSSGGAAAALASGMVALADGSDMMGSLRNPAGWCNVYSLRPSIGMIPPEPGGETYFNQLATVGPMARSPDDMTLLLNVLAGPDLSNPYSRAPDPIQPSPEGLKGKRIGWLGNWGGAMPMDAGILELCETALRDFEAQGAIVESIAPPFDAEEMFQAWTTLRAWLLLPRLMRLSQHKEAMKDSAQWEIALGQTLSGQDIFDASLVRSKWFATAGALFAQFDALVLPTAQVWPFPVDIPYPQDIAGVAMDIYHRWMQVVVPVSLLGLPAVTVPAGFGKAGLPMGLQIFGPMHSDAALIGLANAYHEATNWPATNPAMLG